MTDQPKWYVIDLENPTQVMEIDDEAMERIRKLPQYQTLETDHMFVIFFRVLRPTIYVHQSLVDV